MQNTKYKATVAYSTKYTVIGTKTVKCTKHCRQTKNYLPTTGSVFHIYKLVWDKQ